MTLPQPEYYRTSFCGVEDRKFLPPQFQKTEETPKEYECTTEGKFPDFVKGNLIRLGCHDWAMETSEDGSKPPVLFQHWFDGLAILHRFRIENGKVYHMSRKLNDGLIKQVKKTGRYSGFTIGGNPNVLVEEIDPCSAKLGHQQSVWEDKEMKFLGPDDLNINTTPRRAWGVPDDGNPLSRGQPSKDPAREELRMASDFNMLQICDANTLEPKRLVTYASVDKELSGLGICAHPPKDRKRCTEYNYIIDKTGKLYVFSLHTRSVPATLLWKTKIADTPSYAHSMGVTQQYVVFIRQPVAMAISQEKGKPSASMGVVPNQDTLFYMLDKDDGRLVATYRTAPFLFFHIANAYDFEDPKTGEVTAHVDLCSYPNTHLSIQEYTFSNILDPLKPLTDASLVRYELPNVLGEHDPTEVRRGSVRTAIPNVGVELPRIRKDFSSVPGYRYIWAVAENGGVSMGTEVPIGRLGPGVGYPSRSFFGHVVKTDWLTGEATHWYPTDGDSCPCEPIFIARPGSACEDDGIVLTIVVDRKGTKSMLLALDGQTMREVARAYVANVVGLGFHGTFIEGW